MDGNTNFDPREPVFTQIEASEISGATMANINNWFLRTNFALPEHEKLPAKRRLFSIVDVAKLEVMDFCVRMLDMKPEGAAYAATSIDRLMLGEHQQIEFEGKHLQVWHWIHRTPFGGSEALGDGPDGWTMQGVWRKSGNGPFYQYNPALYPEEEACGFPHFPCISIPTSTIFNRAFLKCTDILIAEHNGE